MKNQKHEEKAGKAKKNIQCENCKAILKSEKYYKRHQESKHPTIKITYICDYDGKEFAAKNYLRIHMDRHKQQIMTCNVCMKAYSSHKIFKRHLISHMKKFHCTECSAVFNHKSLLKNHESIHKKELLFKCNYCTRMFRNTSARNNHHQIAHKNNKEELNFKCIKCKIYFETKEELRIHSFIHFNGDIKTCHICDQIFKTTRLLNVHLQKHSEKKFQCTSCLENFTFKSGLNKHIRLNRCKGPAIDIDEQMTEEEIAQIAKEQLKVIINSKVQSDESQKINNKKEAHLENKINHIEEEEYNSLDVRIESDDETVIEEDVAKDIHNNRPIEKSKRIGRSHNTYTCDKCGESIKYRKNLELHMRDVHLRRIYKCAVCPETFRSKNSYKNHSLENHGVKQRIAIEIYKCTVCEKKFDVKSIFEAHKLSHENVRTHLCSICNASFKNIGNLKRHAITHTDDRNFLCDMCPKNFKSQAALKIHSDSVHAAMKVYVSCPYCKIILQEKNLKIHVFNQHTEEGQQKPFSCNVCDKQFKNEFLLKRHLEHLHFSTNRGIIYDCDQCGLKFNRQRDLRIHSLEHYEGPIHTCAVCEKKFKNKRLLLIHSTVHTNSKFQCNECDSSFKTAGGRRKHIAKNHKQTVEQNIIVKYIDTIPDNLTVY